MTENKRKGKKNRKKGIANKKRKRKKNILSIYTDKIVLMPFVPNFTYNLNGMTTASSKNKMCTQTVC